MKMREYTTKFERSSHFASHMVDTPRKKIKKYHEGLNSSLRHLTMAHLIDTFEALVILAIGLKNDGYQNPKQLGTRPLLSGQSGQKPVYHN